MMQANWSARSTRQHVWPGISKRPSRTLVRSTDYTAQRGHGAVSTTSMQCATWSNNAREHLGATELVVQSAERPTPVRKQLPVRHAGPHNDRHCSCPARRSERPVRAAGEGRGPRRAVRLLRRMGRSERGTVLYPAQEEALIEMVSGANVVLATPTGSGKSLVATG